jgi:hypothetical protein
MKIDSYKCDGCGKMKGETNHWWLIMIQGAAMQMLPWQMAPNPDAHGSDNARVFQHICSQACAIRLISEWMGAQ